MWKKSHRYSVKLCSKTNVLLFSEHGVLKLPTTLQMIVFENLVCLCDSDGQLL